MVETVEAKTVLRDEIIAILQEHMPEIRKLGVSHLAVFGSFARGEDRPGSDVDILVEFDRPVGIFEFLDVKDYLESVLRRPVDLVTRDALKPQLRDRILGEAVRAI